MKNKSSKTLSIVLSYWSLFFILFFPMILTAQDPNDNFSATRDLFNKGMAAYNKNNYKATVIYLYAYIQRSPDDMRNNRIHANEVRSAYTFSFDRTVSGVQAGAKGDCPCAEGATIKAPDNENK